ncbi:MAG: transcription termination/antitermination protein NusA [Verrucomicrobiota bacterium]|jgi:N utilization substance protein A|nr:transcription termination/antitermination protein NusA [Verrucomicrobiota bacterium]MDK2964261.1 transcription termination/antitermination protein NusA [Verrucomicrobiota bacterium]
MNSELSAVVEYMERERGVDREVIIEAIESALQSAANKNSTDAESLRVQIDRKTLDIHAFATKKVVLSVTDRYNEVSLAEARRTDPSAQLDEMIEIESTPRNFGRIAAQTAKQTILQRIRQAEKSRIFEDYKDRIGEIVTGSVRRFERSTVIVELDHGAEGVMPSKERVPTEEYEVGERIRAYILSIKERESGPEIILSRAHPDFVRRLFELEVSEIADGTMEIRGIAREAGYRSKVAVISHDERVDPVGACVGIRGMRVKNIVRELNGEKIDIVRWSDDIKTLVVNALAPAKLRTVEVDEPTHTVTVTVEADQLSLAIGKRGQNARLTSKLIGWRVDIQKDEEDMNFEERVAAAVVGLAAVKGIGEEWAEKLVYAGFLTVEGIMAADLSDLEEIEGVTPEQAQALWSAAEKAYTAKHGEIAE